jgi:hypothetical protein
VNALNLERARGSKPKDGGEISWDRSGCLRRSSLRPCSYSQHDLEAIPPWERFSGSQAPAAQRPDASSQAKEPAKPTKDEHGPWELFRSPSAVTPQPQYECQFNSALDPLVCKQKQ